MLNLRSAVQRCVRRASIVGSSPLRYHTSRNNSNVIYVSRQTFADANVELVENASQHSGIKHLSKIQTTAVTDNKTLPDNAIDLELEATTSFSDSKAPQDITKDSEAEETTSITDTKSSSVIANDPEPEAIPFPEAKKTTSITKSHTLNTTQISKNLEFRRYHIWVRGFSENVTEDMLEEYYSRYGEVIRCSIRFSKVTKELSAVVVFSSKKAMNLSVRSFPHRINNETVRGRIGNLKTELTLRLLNLSPETTEESLREFYSRFGSITRCVMKKETGESMIGYVAFGSHEELDRALDAQPHLIDDSEVFLNYPTKELDLMVKGVPEGITEESLYTFFSQYGRLRECHLFKTGNRAHAHLSFSTINEVNRAMANRPHIIDKKLLCTDFSGNKSGTFAIFIGSLPENATGASLFKAFSKFGKIVYLEVLNDGGMNQRGPYGFVSYGTKEEMIKALDNGPHQVEDAKVFVQAAHRMKSRQGKMRNEN